MRVRGGLLLLCLALLLVPATAHAAESGPGPVTYVPSTGTVNANVFRNQVVRRHTLAIVPLYTSSLPDAAQTKAMGEATKAFWEREIPGLRVTLKYLPPRKLASTCNRVINSAWDAAKKAARINPYAPGNHVVAYAPECNMNGLGSLRPGSGMIFIGLPDPDGSMLAHEFGHNLGLLHANNLTCRTGGATVSLSRSCTEDEYGNWTSVMGNGPLVSAVRAGPLAQVAFTGRVKRIPATGTHTVTLSAGRSGNQAALLKTRFGTLYLSAGHELRNSPQGSTATGELAHVQAEVLTKAGSGLLHFPEVANLSLDGAYGLQLGTTWAVPGTSQRVTVIAADEKSATITVSAASGSAPAPAAPVIQAGADGTYPRDAQWSLTWSAPDGGAAAFLVKAGDSVIARASGKARSVTIPAGLVTGSRDDGTETLTLQVVAVGSGGAETASAPVTLNAVPATLTLTSTAGESPPAVVSSPFRLSWTIAPAIYANAVSSWAVRFAGSTSVLPASQTWIDIDPAVLGPQADGNVDVQGLDAQGRRVVSSRYGFSTYNWWD